MKTTRRFLSMVLALMMILSLSVTAFATEATTPKVVITIDAPDGTPVAPITISGHVGDSVESVVKSKSTLASEWNEVSDYYQPSVKHDALVSLNGYRAVAASASREKDIAALEAAHYDVSKLQWISGRPGYAQLEYNEETGEYHYLYAGYDWTYSSDKTGDIWTYMCCYNLRADETVSLTYKLQITDWWTEDQITPIG